MADMAMLNVRMERELRDRGNAALAELGVTPSQLVRALWEKLADGHQIGRAQVETILTPVRTPEKQAEIDCRLEAARRGSQLFSGFAAKVGLDSATYVPAPNGELGDARCEPLNETYGV